MSTSTGSASIVMIWILACSLQSGVEAYYIGDQGTYTKVLNTFGSQQFSSVNNSDFIILANGNGITGKVAADKTFRVLQLLDLLVPDFVRRIKDVNDDFKTDMDHPFNFPVDNFTLNTDTNEFDIGTGRYDNIEVIPSFLTLRDLTVIIGIGIDYDASSFSERFQLRGLAVAGVWRLDSVGGLDFKISKYGDQWYFRGAPESGTLEVGKFAQDIATAILPSGGLEQSLKNAGLDKFTIENARIIGAMNLDGFAIGLTGSPTIEGWGSFKGHVMVHRYKDQPWQQKRTVVTIGLTFPSFRLSDLIKKVADIDITDIPFLGSLKVPEMGLIVSSGVVDPNLLPEVLDGILTQAKPILKGVAIVIAIPILENQPAVQFIVRLAPKDIRFSIIDPGATLTLKNLISLVMPDFDSSDLSLPPGVSDLLNLQLYGFEYQHQTKSVAVELRFGQKLVLIPDVVSILNPTLYLNVTLKKPRQKRISADGAWTIGSAKFPVELVPAPVAPMSPVKPRITGDKPISPRGFLLKASFADINIKDIIDQFNVEFLPPELQDLLTQASLLDFSIKEPFISIPIGTGSGGFQMQVSGRPQIGDWSGVTLNALLSKKSRKMSLALGMEFANVGFAGLIKQLTGVDVKWISLLDQTLKCAIVISPRTMEGAALQGQVLSKVPINRGLSVVGVFMFPSDCRGDNFCDFMKGVLGSGATMQLRSTISSVKQFTFAATVNDIQLGKGLVLSDAGLEFKIGVETSIGLVASLRLDNPPITFQGALRVGLQGLELEMTMVGIWKKAFGIDWLAFGNAQLAIALKPGVPVFGFAIGGELRLGKLDSGKEIIIAVYLGIDPILPRRNYFYGSVNRASIGALLEAFDWSLELPKVLKESGFPKGLFVSFAFDHIEVPGHVIPAGFRLNGTLNILGFTVSCDIVIDIPRRIKIDIHMSPLNLAGGLLKLYKSRSDSSSGPMFYADIKILPVPSVVVKASGYSSLVGIMQSETTLEISNTEFKLELWGRFFLFDATLRVHATYGSLETAAFSVYGLLSTAWMEELEKRVVSQIDEAGKVATAKLTEAQDKVRGANAAYDAAVRTLQEKQRDVENANRKFDDAIASLQRKQDNVYRLCSLRSCSGVCMGCPGWNGCCRKWWGACIGCPTWNSCCWRAPNLICEAGNLACKALRGIAYVALELAKKIVDGSRWTLDVAKGFLKAAEVIVDNNRWPLDAAIGILEGVKFTVHAGLEAAKFIVRLGLGGIISIRKIEFDVKIGLVTEGHFMGSIQISFLRRHYVTLSFELRFKSVKDMILDLVDLIFPGITGRGRREVADRMKRAFPDFSRRHYFPQTYRPGSYRPEKTQRMSKTTTISKHTIGTPALRYRRDEESPTADKVNDEGHVASTVEKKNDALLSAVNKSEERYNEVIRQLNLVDSEEDEGPDPDVVVSQAKDLALQAKSSKGYLPKEEEEEEEEEAEAVEEAEEAGSNDHLPTLDTCPIGGDRCVSNDLARLLAVFPDVIQGEYDGWKVSVGDFSKLESAVSRDYQAVGKLESETVTERESVEETKAELNSLTNNTVKMSDEEKKRIDDNLSKEESFRKALEEVGKDLMTLNKTARSQLIEQNAQAMHSLKNSFTRLVHRQTGKSLQGYLNALFSCLRMPFLDGTTHPKAQDVLEIMRDLHKKIEDLFETTIAGAKKLAVDIEADLKTLKDEQAFCK